MNANTQFRRAHASVVPNRTTKRLASPDLMAFFRQQRRDLETFRDKQRAALKAFRTASPGAHDPCSRAKTPRSRSPWNMGDAEGAALPDVASDDTDQPRCEEIVPQAARRTDAERTRVDETRAFAHSAVWQARRARPAHPARDGRCVLELMQRNAPTGEALPTKSLQAIKVRWDHASKVWVSDALDALHRAGLLYAVSSVVAKNGMLMLLIRPEVTHDEPWKSDRLRAQALMECRFPSLKLHFQHGDPVGGRASGEGHVRWTRAWMPGHP